MYNGDEKLINNGAYMSYTMLDFWKWAYSNILHNMQRGTFADFIVKCALDRGGVITRSEIGTGLEPYDLEGPVIQSTGKVSRIEVKSAAFVQIWGTSNPERANFSIAPATLPDDTGDFHQGDVRQRNNDIYVFTLYTATKRMCNMLDLSWWEFFVLPTYKIESDERLRRQKTISLKSVKQLCTPKSFDTLCSAIVEACNSVPAKYDIYIFPPRTPKPVTPPPPKIRPIFKTMRRVETEPLSRFRDGGSCYIKNRPPSGIRRSCSLSSKHRNTPNDFSPGYSCRLF